MQQQKHIYTVPFYPSQNWNTVQILLNCFTNLHKKQKKRNTLGMYVYCNCAFSTTRRSASFCACRIPLTLTAVILCQQISVKGWWFFHSSACVSTVLHNGKHKIQTVAFWAFWYMEPVLMHTLTCRNVHSWLRWTEVCWQPMIEPMIVVKVDVH